MSGREKNCSPKGAAKKVALCRLPFLVVEVVKKRTQSAAQLGSPPEEVIKVNIYFKFKKSHTTERIGEKEHSDCVKLSILTLEVSSRPMVVEQLQSPS